MAGRAIASEARVGNVPIQQSAQGAVVPLVYGRNRVGVNLVWYGDFESVEKRQSQGGKGGIDTISYSYYAAILGAVGQGPLSVNRVWRAQQKYLASEIGDSLGLEWHTGTPGQPVWTWLQTKHGGTHQHTTATTSYTLASAVGNGTTATINLSNTPPAPFAVGTQVVVSGMGPDAYTGANPAGFNGTHTVVSSTANSVSFASTLVDTAGPILDPESGMNLPLTGTVTPAQSNNTFSNEDIGYSHTAYLSSSRYSLDQGAQLPNHSVEVTNVATGPTPLPMTIVTDLLRRCGIDTAIVQAAGVNEYATAMGITCSPAITSATTTSDLIDQLAVINNVGIVPSEGKLKFVPYAAQAVGGFTPNLTPAYDLTDDDFVAPGGDPISVTRKSEADTFNHVQCEYADAALDYNTSITEAKDDESISRSGLRTKDKITLLGVTDAAVARLVAQQVLQREIAVRNTYEFTLSPRHVLLEPMDFVTLTDDLLGFDKLVVRITSVEEQADGTIKVSAEDAPLSAFNPALYAYQSNAGFIANYGVAPGNVTMPAFFEPPAFKTTTGLEVWCAVSGQSSSWGGCDVWVSMDGTNYKFDQSIDRGSRYGTLTSALGAGANSGLSVALAGIGGQLLSGSPADAAALNTLCWVGNASGGEFLSYETATLSGVNAYTLGGLLRGAYGTDSGAKAAGLSFVRVDTGVGKSEPLDPDMVGKTIYFKFCSYNIFGTRKQGLAEVEAYPYVITGNMLRLSKLGEALNPSWSPQTIAVPASADGTGAVTGQNAELSLYAGEAKVPFTTITVDADMPAPSVRVSSVTPSAGLTIGAPALGPTAATWTVTGLAVQQATLTVVLRYKNAVGNVFDVGSTVQVTQLRSGQTGVSPPALDISGYTGFSVNAGGAFSPTAATLSAVTSNITPQSYSWAITGATPATAATASVVITPQNGVGSITAVLTVTAIGLSTPLTKTVIMPVVYSGQPGQAGANGVQSAYPSIFRWTSTATPPTRPTTNSTYTWATAAYVAPAGWDTIAPNNTTPGQYLWEITVPLAASAITATSTLDWPNTSYPIRNVSYNGANGAPGSPGSPGSPGTPGANGAAGSATYLVTRSANDSSAPTAAETIAAIGRSPIVGDIAIVNHNDGNASVQYRNTASGYVLQSSYITGSLIVQNTITGQHIAATSVSFDRLNSGNMTGGSSVNAWIQAGQGGTVIANFRSSLNVRKVSADSTLINIAAQNNLDGNVTMWGHSANTAIGNGNGVSGSHTTANTFASWQRLGALGSGVTNAGVWGFTYADNASSRGAVFERYSGSSSASPGSLSRSIQLATASYCAFSPAGQGKIYVVDGSGPFTGFHEGVLPIDDTALPGDIVVDVAVFYRCNISNVLFRVERSSAAAQARALGVVANVVPLAQGVPGVLWEPKQTFKEGDLGPSTTMELVDGFDLQDLQSTYQVVQINAVGEGQINVCGQGGDIQAGDLIVTSALPGKGMKQSDNMVRSITVARARESVVFANASDVQQIACVYLCG